MAKGKLVRDGIPNKIRASGEVPIIRELGEEEYRLELVRKMHEEVDEFAESFSLEELVDIAETLKSARELINVTSVELEEARVEKARKVGGFTTKTYLEGIQ